MKRSVFTSLAGLVVTSCLTTFAQTTTGPQETYPGGERIVQKALSDYNEQVKKNQTGSRPVKEDRIIRSGLLAISDQDLLDHKQFLSERNTGLIRLLPREIYDWRTYKTPPQIDIRGGGAYYSFTFLSHEYGWGSDIGLDQKSLISGFAGADLGILTNLGDVALESISIDDSRAMFLAAYDPPPGEPEARIQQDRISKGFTIDGMEYKRILPCQINSTYLVRSVVYHQSDVLVAFRVVREDKNGSVIIAWKLLKEYPIPELSR